MQNNPWNFFRDEKKSFTNKTKIISTPLSPSEASASETKEKQKLLELVPSELKSSEGENKYVENLMHSLVNTF